jgi:O-methyltransferase involved in polyketide biosynthesis
MSESEITKPEGVERREDHHLISPTALLVAHLRAETDIPYSEAIDEFCGAKATTEELFGPKESLGWMSALLELRYKSLTGLLHSEMESRGIKQVLELASGVQPRGILESVNPEVKYLETDLPDMAEGKKSLVEAIDPDALQRENYSIQSLNVLDAHQFSEVASSLNGEPVAVINEGLLPYLSVAEKEVAVRNIYDLLKTNGGVWITPDIFSTASLLGAMNMYPDAIDVIRKLNDVVGRNVRANAFRSLEEAIQFFNNLGFKVTEHNQFDLVGPLSSLEQADEDKREVLEDALKGSKIWTLEVVE